MADVLEGGCMCGGVRYQLLGQSKAVYYCHCNDCKKSTGSAFHVGLVMHASDVNIDAKNLSEYSKLADSGNRMTRYFCGDCGSPLFTKDSGALENLVVKAGSLDNTDTLNPTAELWVVRKAAWATINPTIISRDKGKACDLNQ